MKKPSRSQLAKTFVLLLGERKQSELIKGLAYELVTSHRAGELELLVRDINRELLAQKNHLELSVTVAHKLGPAARKAVETEMKSRTGARTVHMTIQEDALLLGGLVAETSDERLDLSLRHKLDLLEIQ